MISLDEWNKSRRKAHFPRLSLDGIACPNKINGGVCGAKLWDQNDFNFRDGLPPMMSVHCRVCDFEGWREL